MADIKFELSRLTGYSKEEIIRELQRVAKKLNVSPLTKEAFAKESKVSKNTLRRRFGGWKEALEAAGLGHLYSGTPVTEKMYGQKRNMSDQEIINEIKKVAEIVGSDCISTTDLKKHLTFDRGVLIRRFGSWQKATEAAGFKVRVSPLGKRYTDEECFENLLKVWTHYGRPPMHKEMAVPPSAVGGKAYMLRFGSWNKALQAFVDRVNSDNPADPSDNSCLVQPSEAAVVEKVKLPEDRRDISIGLRFKVLDRDNFKCVKCGHSPATTMGCKLHVDHILPWSKGGKTAFGNLRTLCADCNIGRGNRYSQ